MTTLMLLFTALALAAPGDEPSDERAVKRKSDEPQAEPEPPPDVEPGSTRKAVKVAPGDTIDSIAAQWGFLPADLRAWNELPAGEPEPGTVIQIWVAPVAGADEVPEPDDPKAPKEKSPKEPSEGVGFFAGVQVGPAVSLSALGAAFTPRLELGLELPPLERALRVWVAVQYLKPKATGSANDPRVGGSFDYEVAQDELSIAFGPALRLSMLDAPVIPEASIGPNIYMYRSTANGGAGGKPFPETTEQYTRVGIYGQVGVGVPIGPGELTGHLAVHSSGLNGVVTGEAPSLAISPLVGWRFVF